MKFPKSPIGRRDKRQKRSDDGRRSPIKRMSSKNMGNIRARAETRNAVIHRDRGCCRVCRTYVGHSGHAHEIVYRSLGGDPLDERNVILLCPQCHNDEHRHRIRITGDAYNLIIAVD